MSDEQEKKVCHPPTLIQCIVLPSDITVAGEAGTVSVLRDGSALSEVQY